MTDTTPTGLQSLTMEELRQLHDDVGTELNRRACRASLMHAGYCQDDALIPHTTHHATMWMQGNGGRSVRATASWEERPPEA